MTFGHTKISALSLLLLLGSISACSDSDSDENNSQEQNWEQPDLHCNPVGVAVDCFFPFPSDTFRQEDGVKISPDSLPAYSKKPFDVLKAPALDGFAIHTPIFAVFPSTIDVDSLSFHTDSMDQSTQPSSTTLVLDAETREAVAHFAELDHGAADKDQKLIQIRLYNTLKPNHRYIVAIQNVLDKDGNAFEPIESFQHLAFTENYPFFVEEQQHMREAILPELEAFGVQLDKVQIAWDFTTRSDQSARKFLDSMMDKTQTWLDSLETGPEITIDSVTEHLDDTETEHPYLGFTLRGSYQIPLFLTSNEAGATHTRNEQGFPQYNEDSEAPLLVLIPHSVVGKQPKALIQFGHGFFGSTQEMETSFLPKFLNDNEMVAIGTNWWGLSNADMTPVANALLGNVGNVFNFTDRLEQSFVNQTVLARAAKTSLTDLEEFGSMLDTDIHSFYGISLGHILGSSAVAVSKEIDTAVLSVGGASFSFIMSRAQPFELLMSLIETGLSKRVDQQKFIALASLGMERIDPSTWASSLQSKAFDDGTVDRRILAQVGIGDSSVPTLSALIWARAAGLPLGAPSPKIQSGGFTPAQLPSSDSAFFLYDFQLQGELHGTYSSFPGPDNGVHSAVRQSAKGQEQVVHFLLDHEIRDVCNGLCSEPM